MVRRDPVANFCKTSSRHLIAKIVLAKLCIVGERVNVHVVFLENFGQVRLVHNEEMWTKYQSLWHRADNVNHGRYGTAVSDMEQSSMQI